MKGLPSRRTFLTANNYDTTYSCQAAQRSSFLKTDFQNQTTLTSKVLRKCNNSDFRSENNNFRLVQTFKRTNQILNIFIERLRRAGFTNKATMHW